MNDLPPEELCEGDADLEDEHAARDEPPKRMETGSVQFGDDWPGLFMRGDNALHLAFFLRGILDKLAAGTASPPSIIDHQMLLGIISDLESVHVNHGTTAERLKPAEECRWTEP